MSSLAQSLRLLRPLLVLAFLYGGCDSISPGRPAQPAHSRSLPFLAPEPAVSRRLHPTPPIAPPVASGDSVDSRTWSVVVEGLEADDYATRLFATEALACVHTSAAIAKLARQLGDPEEDVRIAAVAALHRQPGDEARRQLETVRDDEQESLVVRVLAASALVSPPQPCH